jgi:hypothetical protein
MYIALAAYSCRDSLGIGKIALPSPRSLLSPFRDTDAIMPTHPEGTGRPGAHIPEAKAVQAALVAEDIARDTAPSHRSEVIIMQQPFSDDIPEALRTVRTRPLFVMKLDVSALQLVGGPEGSGRRIGVVPSGSFAGERLGGTILDGGNDWQTLRADGSTLLDVRLVLKTRNEALIGMTYTGFRHGPPEVMERIARGESVDPAAYYFRISAGFTTSDPRYLWLNGIIAVGIGHRLATGPVYSLFEIL